MHRGGNNERPHNTPGGNGVDSGASPENENFRQAGFLGTENLISYFSEPLPGVAIPVDTLLRFKNRNGIWKFMGCHAEDKKKTNEAFLYCPDTSEVLFMSGKELQTGTVVPMPDSVVVLKENGAE